MDGAESDGVKDHETGSSVFVITCETLRILLECDRDGADGVNVSEEDWDVEKLVGCDPDSVTDSEWP